MNAKAFKTVKNLIQLDFDAVQAYDQAIQGVDIPEIKAQLTKFRDDHERHVRDLSVLLRNQGQDVPERKKDMKGFFLEGFTAIRSATGTEGALKAMRTNEELTNKTYKNAINDVQGWPEALDVVQRNLKDEERHLDYIKQTLSAQPWKGMGGAPRP